MGKAREEALSSGVTFSPEDTLQPVARWKRTRPAGTERDPTVLKMGRPWRCAAGWPPGGLGVDLKGESALMSRTAAPGRRE